MTKIKDLLKSQGKDVTVELLFLTMLSVTPEAYWGYSNDSPVIQFVNWEENNIPVYDIDSENLGAPTANSIILKAKMVNLMGWFVGIPTCFISVKISSNV